jgi:hypothetical protein
MNSANVVQAARGPILLITLGALMVIDYHTPFSFSHTWPVLIIVFGILKLLERVAGPPEPPIYGVPSAPGAPGVSVPPGFQAPPGPYPPAGAYQGSMYEPAPGYEQAPGYEPHPGVEPPVQNPGGHPQ